jgi:hypothetical protein
MFVCHCYQIEIKKLVEENVYVKPMDGPSNGQREDKDEKKEEQDEAASSSEGKLM